MQATYLEIPHHVLNLSMLSTFEIVATILFLLVSSAFIHHFLILGSGPHDPPLVKGPWPILGCGLELQKDMKSFLLENRAKYGGIFSIYVLGARIHIVSDPVHGIPMFFRSKNFGFNDFANKTRLKAFVNTKEEVTDTELTEGLVASIHNDLLSNEGTTELTRRFVEHMVPSLERFIDGIGEHWKEVELLDFCSRLVFELSNVAVMGPTFPKDNDLYHDLLKFEDNFLTMLKLPGFFIKKEQAHAQKLIDRMADVYKKGMDASRIIRVRMKLSIERGKEEYIPKDLLTIAWASLTNAMPTLFWYLAYMHCKDQQGEFIEEIKRCVGQPKLSNLNLGNVLSSELLHAGLKETLRIHGHNISPRTLEEDTVLKIQGKEYILKKGSVAFAPSTLVNWNPEIYAKPDLWKVERFLGNTQSDGTIETKYQKTQNPGADLGCRNPCGNILRRMPLTDQCPGRRFAANEMIMTLALVLLCFELAPPEGEESFPLPSQPVKDQYGMGVKGPVEPYKVRMRVRKEYLNGG